MGSLTVPQALQLLQVQPGASPKQIRAAYKKLALQLHPDKQQQHQSAQATAAFTLLSAAYDLLLKGSGSEQHTHQYATAWDSLPPFETAYATGDLFTEQLIDEAVLHGCCPGEIALLKKLSEVAAAGQLAAHLAAHPPSRSDEHLWQQLYTRLKLRHQAKQQQQQQQQQPSKQQQQAGGVCLAELLTDVLLRPTGPLLVEDSEDLQEDSEDGSHCHQNAAEQQPQQAVQQAEPKCGSSSSSSLSTAGSCTAMQHQQHSKQHCAHHNQQQQQQQQQLAQVLAAAGEPCKKGKHLRRGWGFYWTWLRRILVAKAVVSLLSSGLKAKMREHYFPEPLDLKLKIA